MILRQANGEISIGYLMHELRLTRDVLERRARELGVRLRLLRNSRLHTKITERRAAECRRPLPDEVPELSPAEQTAENPCRIYHDALLERLRTKHGNRWYEELQISKRVRKVAN